MKFEDYFEIVSTEPGIVSFKPTKRFAASLLSAYEARRMAEHILKIVNLLERTDAGVGQAAHVQGN